MVRKRPSGGRSVSDSILYGSVFDNDLEAIKERDVITSLLAEKQITVETNCDVDYYKGTIAPYFSAAANLSTPSDLKAKRLMRKLVEWLADKQGWKQSQFLTSVLRVFRDHLKQHAPIRGIQKTKRKKTFLP